MKENNNPFAYISIVAIVAIVALFVMFAGNNKQTSETIVLSGGDVVGDARHISEVQKRDGTSLSSEEMIQRDINDGFLKEGSSVYEFFWDEEKIEAYIVDDILVLRDKITGEERFRGCGCPKSCEGGSHTCHWTIDGSGICRGRCSVWSWQDCDARHCSSSEADSINELR